MPESLLFNFVPAAAIMVFAVALHEVAHAVVALSCGFRVAWVLVGPLRLARDGNGWRLSLIRSRFGGETLAVPRHATHLRRRLTLVIAAGPAVNLALGVVLLALAVRIGSADAHNWLLRLPLAAGAWSLFLGAMNILPRRASVTSDGSKLRVLLRGGAPAERLCARRVLVGEILQGRRPRDWTPALLRTLATALDEETCEFDSAMQTYYWALDSGDVELAAKALTAMTAAPAAPTFRAVSRLEAAYFHAFVLSDAPLAKPWLAAAYDLGRGVRAASGLQSRMLQPVLERAEAAVAFACGDVVAARKHLLRGLSLVAAGAQLPGALAFERDLLTAIATAALEQEQPSPPAQAPSPSPQLPAAAESLPAPRPASAVGYWRRQPSWWTPVGGLLALLFASGIWSYSDPANPPDFPYDPAALVTLHRLGWTAGLMALAVVLVPLLGRLFRAGMPAIIALVIAGLAIVHFGLQAAQYDHFATSGLCLAGSGGIALLIAVRSLLASRPDA